MSKTSNMKYVRTKDGIYTFEGAHTITKIYDLSSQGIPPLKYADGTLEKEGDKFVTINHKDYKVTDKNVADTIEELCDRCVVIHKYGEQPKDMSFYEAQYFIDVWTRKVKSNDPIVAIYGAIWTEKGLIFVAKMNDEGVLKLL